MTVPHEREPKMRNLTGTTSGKPGHMATLYINSLINRKLPSYTPKPIKFIICLKHISKENNIKWENTTEHIKKGMHYVFPTVTTVRGLSAQGWGRTRIKVPESSQLLKPTFP